MSAVRLSRLLAPMVRVAPDQDREVTGLTLHSGRVHPGDLFLAVAGTRGHGLAYLEEAVRKGAAAVAWEPAAGVSPPSAGVPLISVPGLRREAGAIAARYYDEPSRRLPVLGVTGTNGKSSCTWLLARAVNAAGGDGAVIGTLGSGRPDELETGERTTPDPVNLQRRLSELVDAGCTLVAMEVSSHALEQGRVSGTHFLLALFTNLSRDHLDYHGDMAAYGRAKRRLFEYPDLQIAVVNVDDPFGRELARTLPRGLRRVTYGVESRDADVRLDSLKLLPSGLVFDLLTPVGRAPVKSRLLGRFNAANLLAVAAALHALGWMAVRPPGPRRPPLAARPDAARIAAWLADLPTVPGRMERLPRKPGRPLVVIDYAHTPDALEHALKALRSHTRGKLICVFGCGGERDTGKRPLMGALAERLADRVYVTDDNPRGEDPDAIVQAVLGGMAMPARAVVERDRDRAVAEAIAHAGEHDLVLLAGKGHETSQEIAGRRIDYSDRAAAESALAGGGS